MMAKRHWNHPNSGRGEVASAKVETSPLVSCSISLFFFLARARVEDDVFYQF